jgi:hypothetical protein
VEDDIVVAGLPVSVPDQIDDTRVLGHPEGPCGPCDAEGTKVVRSKGGGFANDAVDIRPNARLGLLSLNEPAVVRGYNVA